MAEIERKAKLFTEANKGKTSEEILAEMRGEEPVSEELKVELEKYIKDHFTIDTEQLDRFGIEEKDYMYSMDKSDMLALVEHFINWHKTKEESVIEEFEKEIGKVLTDYYGTRYDDETTVELSAFDIVNIAHHFAKWGKNQAKVEIQEQSMALAYRCPKESVCEDLEEAMQHNAPNNIGIDDLLYWRNGFITGSKWQKEQLIKNAIFGEWFRCAVVLPSEYNADDVKKVKLIFVKED